MPSKQQVAARQRNLRKAQKVAQQYWASMTPEQRKAEMKRRMGKKNKAIKRMPKSTIVCPVCHEKVSTNNIHRHLQSKHDLTKLQARRAATTGILPKPKEEAVTHDSGSPSPQTTSDYSNHVSYIWGKVETLIEHYCDSSGVPRAAVTSGLAGILQHSQGRKVLGA